MCSAKRTFNFKKGKKGKERFSVDIEAVEILYGTEWIAFNIRFHICFAATFETETFISLPRIINMTRKG